MANVINLFRRNSSREQPQPKHRREGFFNDQDEWHEREEGATATTAE